MNPLSTLIFWLNLVTLITNFVLLRFLWKQLAELRKVTSQTRENNEAVTALRQQMEARANPPIPPDAQG
jgi:hypothetical protein